MRLLTRLSAAVLVQNDNFSDFIGKYRHLIISWDEFFIIISMGRMWSGMHIFMLRVTEGHEARSGSMAVLKVKKIK